MINIIEILNKIQEIEFNFSEIKKTVGIIDREVSDITHFIEFNNLNAKNGYKIYKLLQTKLQERRKIKDDMSYMQIICSNKISDIVNNNLIDNHDKNLQNRTYIYKELDDNFFETLLK